MQQKMTRLCTGCPCLSQMRVVFHLSAGIPRNNEFSKCERKPLNHKPDLFVVRCGTHMIHLAAKHFLAAISPSHWHLKGHATSMSNDSGSEDEEEDQVADSDPVMASDLAENKNPSWVPGNLFRKCLAFVTQVGYSVSVLFNLTVWVTQVWLSPQAQSYFTECCEKSSVKPLQLVSWIQTCWSSMYAMMGCLLELQPICCLPAELEMTLTQLKQAVDLFLAMADWSPKVPKLKNKKYVDFMLSPEEWKQLHLIHEVLKVSISSAIFMKCQYVWTVHHFSNWTQHNRHSLTRNFQHFGRPCQPWNSCKCTGKIWPRRPNLWNCAWQSTVDSKPLANIMHWQIACQSMWSALVRKSCSSHCIHWWLFVQYWIPILRWSISTDTGVLHGWWMWRQS